MSDKVIYVLNSGQNGGIGIGNGVTELPNTYANRNTPFQNNLAFNNVSVNPAIKVVGVHNENQTLSKTTSVNCFEIRKKPSYLPCGVSPKRGLQLAFDDGNPNLNSLSLINPVNGLHTLTVTTNGDGVGGSIVCNVVNQTPTWGIVASGDGYAEGDTITLTNSNWSQGNANFSVSYVLKADDLNNLPHFDETAYNENQVAGNSAHVLNRVFPRTTSISDYLTNQENTSNYRLKCYDGGYPAGVLFNPKDFDTYDYFVVIKPDIIVEANADQTNIRTHFAKIKEITSFDEQGDSFEFEPKFSSNIPLGTKFEIWRGPRKDDTDVVALSYGLRGNSVASDTTIENFVTDKYDVFNKVSRPTFYFYKDRLDEKDRLNYNTKYILTSSRWWDNYTLTGKTLAGSGTANFTSQTVNTNGSWTYQPIVGQSVLQVSTTGSYRWIGNVTNVNNVGNAPITIAHGMHRIKNTEAIYIGSSHYHSVFKTKTEHENKIIDSSRLTVHANLIDNHKINDETSTPIETLHPNTGGNIVNTYTFDNLLWSHAFRNKNRQLYDRNSVLDSHYLYKDGTANANFNANNPLHTDTIFNDDWSWKLSGNFIGDETYTKYINSPEKTNKLPNATSMVLKESNNELSSLLSLEVLDGEGVLHKKINDGAKIRLRNELNSTNISLHTLNGLVSSTSITSDTLNITGISHTLTNILQSGDTIKVGEYFYIINTIGSLSSLGTQDIVISAYRHKDSNMFTSVAQVRTIHENVALECYSYFNSKVFGFSSIKNTYDYSKNLPTISGMYKNKEDIEIYESELTFRENFYNGKRVNIDYGDSNYSYIVPRNHTKNIYHPNPVNIFEYYGGSLLLESKLFNGAIENKRYETSNGIKKLKLDGRNDFNELHGVEISKKLTFSEEFLYSTFSPYGDITYTPTTTFVSANLDFVVSNYTNNANAGSNYTFTTPFTVNKSPIQKNLIAINASKCLMGIVDYISLDLNNNVVNYQFKEKPLIEPANTDTIFLITYENLYAILGKSIETEVKSNIHSTHLEGASSKGIVFDSGRYLSPSSLAEYSSLIGSSASGRYDSKGYSIYHPRGIINQNDGEFAFRMGEENYSRSSIKNIHVKSATQKLPIVKITKTGEETSSITVAAISPIVLGRVEQNTSDTLYSNSNGLYLMNHQGLYDGGIIHRLSSRTANKPITKVTSGVPEIFRYIGLETGKNGFLAREPINTLGASTISSNRNGENTYAKISNSGICAYARVYLTKTDFTLVTPTFDLDNSPFFGSNFTDGNFPDGQTYFHPLTIPNLDPNVSYNGVAGNVNGSVEIDGPVKMLKERWIFSDPSCYTYDLFSIGDIYPNSYNSDTHLLSGNSDLTKYSAIVTNEGNPDTSKPDTQHTNYSGSSNRNQKTDKDYQALKITSYSKNNPKRFSLIRLVEDTYDWHFNPFNAINTSVFGKNLIEKSGYGSSKRWSYSMWSSKSCPKTTGFNVSQGNSFIACNTNINATDHELFAGDLVYKGDGTYIGQIIAINYDNNAKEPAGHPYGSNNGNTDNEIILHSSAKATLSFGDTVRIIQRGHSDYDRIYNFDVYGSNKNKGLANDSIDRTWRMNFTRTVNINDRVKKDYMPDEDLKNNNKTLVGPIFYGTSQTKTPPNRPSEWESGDINDSTLSTDNFYYHPSKILNSICHRDETQYGITTTNQNIYRHCMAVLLNPKPPFGEAEKHRMRTGMTNTVDDDNNFVGDYWGTDSGDDKSSARIKLTEGYRQFYVTRIQNYVSAGNLVAQNSAVAGWGYRTIAQYTQSKGFGYLEDMANQFVFTHFNNLGASVSADLVFKPQIYIANGGVTVSNNSNTITIDSTTANASLQWINYTPNLKGRFLVGNKGQEVYGTDVIHFPSDTNDDYSDNEGEHGLEPTYIGKITEHTSAIVNGQRVHTLTLDKSWGTVSADIGVLFRLMRIEPKTLDKRKQFIPLYTLNNGEVLNTTDSEDKVQLVPKPGSLTFPTSLKRDNEGVFELYLIASNDQTFSTQEAKWTIIRSASDLTFLNNIFLGTNQSKEVYITDGNNGELVRMKGHLPSTSYKGILFPENLKNDYYGAVSFGETILLNTETSPQIENPSHLIISPELTICSEASKMVEELLEENSIDFNMGRVGKKETNLLVESSFYSSTPNLSYIIVDSPKVIVDSNLKDRDTIYVNNVILGRIHSIVTTQTTKTKINVYQMLNIPPVNGIVTYFNERQYFVSGKIAGDDLLSAINYLGGYKDIVSSVKDEVITFNSVDLLPSSKANLSYKNENIYVENTENTKSLFSYANKIIVYGDGVKVVAERQQKGKKQKTLTYFNDNIKTKSDAKVKAEELLDLHSNSRDKIKIKLHQTGLEFLKPGDIITLNFPQQEIPKDDYMVFEIENSFMDSTELTIVSYDKSIAERFAELNIAEKKTATKLFNKDISSAESIKRGYSKYEINPLSLTVRHNVVTGNNALSWSAIMGFNKTFGLQTINGTDVVIDLIE